MYEFIITWESGKIVSFEGDTLIETIHKAGYHECVLEKMVSFVKTYSDDIVNKLLSRQNDYIRGNY